MSGPRRNLLSARIIPKLPDAINSEQRGELFPPDLDGSKIVNFDAAPPEYRLEGGGLIIDYIPDGSVETKRIVLGFNELGMWIQQRTR